MTARFFHLCDHAIPLPENRSQYTAIEACAMIHEVRAEIDDIGIRNSKGIRVKKVVDAMINHKVNFSHEVTSLISVMRSVICCVYNKYKGNGEAC